MKLILILTSVLLSGCVTSKMWNHSPVYDETIVGFYLVEGKHDVVAVGKKYNYLFKVKPEMYEAFRISSEYDFSLSFRQFRIFSGNDIRGGFTLGVDKSVLSERELKQLGSLGFGWTLNNPYALSHFISGIRYQAGGTEAMRQFEKGYKVQIKEPNEGLLYAGKAAISPLTLAIDTLVLVPIVLTIIVFDIDVSGTRH